MMKHTIAIVVATTLSVALFGGVLVSADEIMFSAQEVGQIVTAVSANDYHALGTGMRTKISTEQFALWMQMRQARGEIREQIKQKREDTTSQIKEIRSTASGAVAQLREYASGANHQETRKNIVAVMSGAKAKIAEKKQEQKESKDQLKAQKQAIEQAIAAHDYEAFKRVAHPNMLATINSAEKFDLFVKMYQTRTAGTGTVVK